MVANEMNKGEAERSKTIGADALKQGQYDKAAKFFKKSLQLYPLPGVETLLSTAARMANGESSNSNSNSNNSNNNSDNGAYNGSARRPVPAPSSAPPPSTTPIGGRSYTRAHVEIIEKILHAKEGGRGAHYRVLGIAATANESEIKKAYRKLAIKVHPDKNSAPKSDEAFKAVGLAYATLSDSQKRTIYDRYGEEDPDNRGGGGGGQGFHRGPRGGMQFRPGQEVNPEDIFNMFFGGGMGGGGMHRGPGGVHFSTNFGGVPRQQQQQRRGRTQGGQRPQNEQEGPAMANFIQLLPFLVIMLLSFFNMSNDQSTGGGSTGGSNKSPGLNRYYTLSVSCSYPVFFHSNVRFLPAYFSPFQIYFILVHDCPCFLSILFCCALFSDIFFSQLVHGFNSHRHNNTISLNQKQSQEPFVNPLHTKLTKVKDIPYFVDNKFLRTLYRDRYQLAQVERMVEGAYENYLVDECNIQRRYKRKLLAEAGREPTQEEIALAKKTAEQFHLTRCVELNNLFPLKHSGMRS